MMTKSVMHRKRGLASEPANGRCRAPDDWSLHNRQGLPMGRVVPATVPGARVAVCGSRATGQARPFSDVDLFVLHPSPMTWQQRTALVDALKESKLPFRLDVVEAAAVPL